MKIKIINSLCSIGKFLEKNKFAVAAIAFLSINMMSFVFASKTIDAAAKWEEVMMLIVPWIQRFGGVVMLIGGVMLGMGFRSDAADLKSQGVSTIIAGGILIGVAAASTTFIW